MADRLTRALLWGTILLPLFYYGIQLALAPFYAGYDFRTDVASLLGSDRAPYPVWFNLFAALSGVAAIAGAVGLWRFLARQAALWIRLLLLLAIVGLGCGNIWAGIFPLPDPRHGANPFAPAFFAMPLLLCAAGWLAPGLRALRWLLTVNLLLFAAYASVMAGLTAIDIPAHIGLLQRFGAFTIMGAIGIVGFDLLRRAERSPGQRPPRTSPP